MWRLLIIRDPADKTWSMMLESHVDWYGELSGFTVRRSRTRAKLTKCTRSGESTVVLAVQRTMGGTNRLGLWNMEYF